MDERKLLKRLARGAVTNGAVTNVSSSTCGASPKASASSCVVSQGAITSSYTPEVPQLINLQSVHGHAKPYQIRQLLRLVERYDLRLEDRP